MKFVPYNFFRKTITFNKDCVSLKNTLNVRKLGYCNTGWPFQMRWKKFFLSGKLRFSCSLIDCILINIGLNGVVGLCKETTYIYSIYIVCYSVVFTSLDHSLQTWNGIWLTGFQGKSWLEHRSSVIVLLLFKKFINNSRGKYKRN